jgi:hypothetical protein
MKNYYIFDFSYSFCNLKYKKTKNIYTCCEEEKDTQSYILIQKTIVSFNMKIKDELFKIMKIYIVDYLCYIIFLLFFCLEITIYSNTGLIIDYSIGKAYLIFGFIIFIVNLYFYFWRESLIAGEKRKIVNKFYDHVEKNKDHLLGLELSIDHYGNYIKIFCSNDRISLNDIEEEEIL